MTSNDLTLSEEELEKRKCDIENSLEQKIKSIHQSLYDDPMFKNALETNQKLYLFCGLIMACLDIPEIGEFDIEHHTEDHDGIAVLKRIEKFLEKKNPNKSQMIIDLLRPVFVDLKSLYRTDLKGSFGESLIKRLFNQIKNDILPCLTTDLHLDFAGKIMNSLNVRVHLENDKANDVVLTPRYVTSFMAKLAHTNMNSYVWDCAMGSAGFLVSAMELMIRDAESKIKDNPIELENKKNKIKKEQILGIEILGNVYILACLNMFLMGDCSSNIIKDDTFNCDRIIKDSFKDTFPATVFLLNPPYSAPGKGLNFVEFALAKMTKGYGCVLIQENAGSGNGSEHAKNILKNNSLVASIHMPSDLFMGKASVQTAIYLFKVNQPHDPDSLVTFIDMSMDGYSRQNRRKSSQSVNLKDTDNAKERYQEVVDIILGRKPKTNYYTEANGLVIRDSITLNGDDWTYAQHKVIDVKPTIDDFKNSVKEYLTWKVSQVIQQENINKIQINSRLEELENDFINNGGYFKECLISDLFLVEGTKSLNAGKLNFSDKGINFVGRTNEFNGVQGKISKQNFEPNEPNTITATVIGNYKYVKFQDEPYYCSQNINKLTPKFAINKARAIYFIAGIQKFVESYNGQQSGYTLNELKDSILYVPMNKNSEIDFDFIDKYIHELEIQRINELELYLNKELDVYRKVTGLND